MDVLIGSPAPLLVASLRTVLAVTANPVDLVCGPGGLLAALTGGLQIRLAYLPSGTAPEDLRQLRAAADELGASEVVAVPTDVADAGGLEDTVAGLIAGSDAVLVAGASDGWPAGPAGKDMDGGECRRRLREAASTAAARQGRLFLEWLSPKQSRRPPPQRLARDVVERFGPHHARRRPVEAALRGGTAHRFSKPMDGGHLGGQ